MSAKDKPKISEVSSVFSHIEARIIRIKTSNGRFFNCEDHGYVRHLNSDNRNSYFKEILESEDQDGNMRVRFRGATHGKYINAHYGGSNGHVTCNTDQKHGGTLFTRIRQNNGTFAYKTVNGLNYLVSRGTNAIETTTNVAEKIQFEVEEIGPLIPPPIKKVRIKGPSGKYFRCHKDTWLNIGARIDDSIFRVIYLGVDDDGNRRIQLKSQSDYNINPHYGGANGWVTCNTKTGGILTEIRLAGGRVAYRTENKINYLTEHAPSNKIFTAGSICEKCRFKVEEFGYSDDLANNEKTPESFSEDIKSVINDGHVDFVKLTKIIPSYATLENHVMVDKDNFNKIQTISWSSHPLGVFSYGSVVHFMVQIGYSQDQGWQVILKKENEYYNQNSVTETIEEGHRINLFWNREIGYPFLREQNIAEKFISMLNNKDDTEYVFGDHNEDARVSLHEKISNGNNNWFPTIKYFNSGRIDSFDGTNKFLTVNRRSTSENHPLLMGAYERSSETIYLNKNLLDPYAYEELSNVLIQEIAHHIDKRIEGDQNGAEGLIACTKLCTNRDSSVGRVLGEAEHKSLRKHDDKAHISLYLNNENIVHNNVELGFWKKHSGLIAMIAVPILIGAAVVTGGATAPETLGALLPILEAASEEEGAAVELQEVVTGLNQVATEEEGATEVAVTANSEEASIRLVNAERVSKELPPRARALIDEKANYRAQSSEVRVIENSRYEEARARAISIALDGGIEEVSTASEVIEGTSSEEGSEILGGEEIENHINVDEELAIAKDRKGLILMITADETITPTEPTLSDAIDKATSESTQNALREVADNMTRDLGIDSDAELHSISDGTVTVGNSEENQVEISLISSSEGVSTAAAEEEVLIEATPVTEEEAAPIPIVEATPMPNLYIQLSSVSGVATGGIIGVGGILLAIKLMQSDDGSKQLEVMNTEENKKISGTVDDSNNKITFKDENGNEAFTVKYQPKEDIFTSP